MFCFSPLVFSRSLIPIWMLCNQACPRPQLCKTPKEPQTERGRSRRQLIRHFFLSVLMLQRWGKGCILKIIFAKERWGRNSFHMKLFGTVKFWYTWLFLACVSVAHPVLFSHITCKRRLRFPLKNSFPSSTMLWNHYFQNPYHCSTEVYFKRKSTERRYGSIRFLLAS